MNTLELMSHMRSLDVRVWAEGERLRYRGPVAALTQDLLSEMARQKQAILGLLAERNVGRRSSVQLRAQRRPARIPLSFDQESQWLLHRLEPDSPAYHIPFAIRLDGDLDARAMAASIDALVRRHEILRTVFPEVDGEPVQAILPPSPGNLPRVDLTGCPEGAREREAGRVAAENAQRPFDLTRGTGFRAALVRISRTSHLLLINLHHITIDDWSINLLMGEVAEVYRTLYLGGAPLLAELTLQYADFAIWQRGWLRGETLERLQGYWQKRLDGCPEVLPLATDRPRPVQRSSRGGESRLVIGPSLTAELERLSRQQGGTLFMTLLAAFKVLLLHHAETDDLVVGTPMGGRSQVELEQVLGLFVNVLAIRTDLSGQPSFVAVLERVRTGMLEAYAHAELPFTKLVETIRPRRGLNYNPLVQVLFALTREEEWASALPGLQTSIERSSVGAATFDLAVILWQRESDVFGFFEHSADLFDACTAARIAQRFVTLLQSIVAAPERAVQELSPATAAERHQLLHEWNDTRYEKAQGLVIDWVEEQARRAPQQVAVVALGGGKSMTYGELVARSNQLARFLRRLGIGPEDRVGVCCERSLELVVALCGVFRAGGTYVPLDPSYPAERLAWMLSDAQPRVLLIQEHLRARLPGDAGQDRLVLALDDAWDEVARESMAELASVVEPTGLAYVLYTSGSSGRPKGVMVSHGSLANFVDNTRNLLGLSARDRTLQFASIAFDVSVKEILSSLSAGATLVLRDGSIVASFTEFAAACRSNGLTVVDLPVAFLHELAGSLVSSGDTAWPPRVRQVMFGGERALPERLAELARCVGPGVQMINGYGPTETTVEATRHTFKGGAAGFDGRDLPIGRPLANVQVYAVDPWGGLAPLGVPGELCVAGARVARGYLGRPERTALSFVPDPWSGLPGARLYRTGDRVRWRTDGELEFLGRIDSQVKIRGFRVELGEIESVLAEHPAVSAVVVVANVSQPGSPRLVGYWVPRAGVDASAADLRAFLLSRLPDYMVPAMYVPLAALPRTPNNKVDRRALPAAEPGTIESGVYAAPRTVTEQVVAGIWEELLGLERVSVDADFFALGGHSLLAIQLVSRLRAGFAVELTVRDIFDNPTVATLGARIDEVLKGDDREAELPIVPVAREGGVELSFAQQRLWFLDQLAPGGASYNIPAGFLLKGPLSAPCFARALSEVARRHEALRTRFALRQGRPMQIIEAPAPVPLPVVDLGGLAEPWRAQELRRRLDAEALRPFDLVRGPLWRAHLLRLATEEHAVVLVLHHIVSDGWSMGLLIEEVGTLYRAFAAGKPSPLAELPIQFADFSHWQRQWLQGEVLETQLVYWREVLGGVPPLLGVPTDRPRPAVQSGRGAEVVIRLPETTAQAVAVMARRLSASPFMVVLAAFQLLLGRYADSHDVVVGAPIAGRQRIETERLIGLFVNLLALRSRWGSGSTVRELVTQVRDRTLGAHVHQDLPFERLVEELRLPRDLAYEPLVQVVFSLDVRSPETAVPGWTVTSLAPEVYAAKFDLHLGLASEGGELSGTLGYSRDLFDGTSMRRLLGHFETLLGDLTADPERPLKALGMLQPAEGHQLLGEWNDTILAFDGEACLHERVAAQAARTPTRVALVWGNERISYGDLKQRVSRLARRLCRVGVGPESRVGIALRRTPDLVVALLAVLEAGGAYVPLDPAYPRERLAFILADAQEGQASPVLLSERRVLDRLPDFGGTVLCLDEMDLAGESAEVSQRDLPRRAVAGNLAYLIYTSGSTGRPKGVAITHRSAASLLDWGAPLFSAAELAGVLAATSITFDVSVFELFMPLTTGGTVLLADDVLALPHLPAADEVRLVSAVPSALAALVRTGGLPSGVRTVNLGGEALPHSLVEEIYALPWVTKVHNLYGPSEDTTYSTWALVPRNEAREPTIGMPVGNSQAYVVNRDLDLQPVGVRGELFLGGEGLARGYLHRPELTAERFVPDPFAAMPGSRLYRTGDLARRRADGQLEFFGRLDHQVKLRGFRIELGEIEVATGAHPEVVEAAVLLRDDLLVAYVAPAVPSDLREWLHERLPAHMIPTVFVPLAALPLTPNGKVDRRALPTVEPGTIESGVYAAPRTVTEQVVAGIWEELLGLERVSVDADFFALGGHSLLAIQLVSRLRAGFAVELTVRDIFDSATVAALGARIDEELKGDHGEAELPIVPVAREGGVELSFAQQRLWFLDQLAPGGASYNIPAGFLLKGPLSAPCFARALSEVARRHEALRTRFALREGRPVQIIEAPAPVPLPVVDLGGLAEPWRAQELRRRLDAEALRPFDLVRGPLWRAHLLRLATEEHAVVLVLHHIVSDGWSMGLLIEEVGALYRAFAAGKPSPLAELPIQFADFSHWQRQWLQGEVLETQLVYWREVLGGVPPLLGVPTDRPRPAVQSGRGAEVAIRLPETTAQAVAVMARRLSASPFMVVLAAFQLLLGRYADSRDVVVGAPIAGRQRIETERLIGLFVNLLALRSRWGSGSTVRELVTQVRDRTLGAHVHQDLPFERLVEELRLPRDLAYEPLVQVVFSLDVRSPETAVPGWTVTSLAPEVYTAKFDLHLGLASENGELSGTLGYSRDLFDGTSMRRLLGHFEALLGDLTADPERPLRALEMLQPAERQQLLGEWNDRAAGLSTECPVHALVEAIALASPEAIALVHAGEQLTYGELVARSRRLSHLLRARGVGPEVAVAVCADRSLARTVCLLAILEAGGAYVPLDPELPAERLAYMLRDCAAPVVLTERRLAARLPAAGAAPLLLDGDWETAGGEAEGLLPLAPVEVTASHLAYIIYTSGSTGRPKGVEVTHGSLLHLIAWHLAAHEVSAADRATQLAGFGFDAAVWELWPYLVCGASVYMATAETMASPELLRDWLVANSITVSFLPTPLAEIVIALPWPATAPLRRLLTGGDRLHAGPPACLPFALFNHYGPTESTVVASWCAVASSVDSRSNEGLPPIGRPVDGSTLYVLDADGGVLPAGAVGELFIGGAGVARGYRQAAAATAERFLPDPFAHQAGSRYYRTGDRVRYRPDGNLEFLGRLDDQVKIRGFRIELGEIEGTLASHPAVREAAVAARETGGDRRLVAFWAAAAGMDATAQELRAFLRDRLPESMVPVTFQRLPALPLTANGKVDRLTLVAEEEDSAPREGAGLAPRDLLELQLVQLWQEVLGVQAVSVRDSFFDLGGHSLLAVRLIAAIERRYGRQLPLSTLFQAPTVEALSAILRGQGDSAPASSLVILRQGEPRPSLSLVHPVGGHVFAYLPLAQRLGAERPLFGFQSHAALPDRAPDDTIEKMAQRYIDELVTAQPAGPYHLAGWSIGGFVALEMACRLEAAGRRVGLVALFDTSLAVAGSVPLDEVELMTTFVLDRGLPEEQAEACTKELRPSAPVDRLARMHTILLREALVPPDLDLATLHKLFALFGANFAAARAYRPRFFAGRIDLFAALESLGAQSHPDAGWSELAAEVAVHSMPGGHFTMLQEPQVQRVAERLAFCLASQGESESEHWIP